MQSRLLKSLQGKNTLTALAAACLLACASGAQAQTAQALYLPDGAVLDNGDGDAGVVRVIVQFDGAPVTRMRRKIDVATANRAEMARHVQTLRAAKATQLQAIRQLGGRVQNTLEFAINGAVIDVRADRMAHIQRLPGVKSVRRAGVYTMSPAAPSIGELIGTAQANALGNKGAGVAIGYLDSGIDYTHASFGGPGTVAYYTAAKAGAGVIGDTPGVFPNGPRVKGGYDWVGETWPNTAILPDPDPLDLSGHGTNGASAAAGNAVPAGLLPDGSAPEAMLLAYKVCSSVASSCEGSALLNSMESVIAYAAGQPNFNQVGANNPALPAGTRFVINMSLGSTYGNPLIDDLSEASRNAVRAGITVVASAGNSNDIPYITGTPSGTDTVISVAASQPATLTGPALTVGAPLNSTYPMITASFGIPLVNALTAPLAFAGPSTTSNLACSGTLSGTANPGPASPPIPALGGALGLADRGTCGFNEKALNVQRAGGSAAIISNNAANAGPLGMGAGPAAPSTTIPSYSLGTAEGAGVKAALAANPGLQGTITPLALGENVAGGINLVDLISDFSSRGPSQAGNALKPDITAPGSNIWMAAFGTGNRGMANSGTSFSGPLTSGAAALVLSGQPGFTPWQVKAALMNTANPNVFATKTAAGTTLAGLTRMGGGRLQADRAIATGTLAYDSQDIDPTGGTYYNTALSYGPQAFTVAGSSSVSRTVVVQNLGNSAKTYAVGVTPRFANDTTKGVTFSTSVNSLTVAANSTATFNVVATAVGTQLPTSGGLPVRLQQTDTCTTTTNPPAPVAACTNKFNDVELDGFVTLDGGNDADRVTVPYLMYPRAASAVAVSRIGSSVITRNTGVGATFVDVFNLVGTQDPQDQPVPVAGSEDLPIDIKAVGIRYTVNGFTGTLPTGVTSGDIMEFAVSLWRPVDTWRLVVMNVELDINNDGVTDFTVRNLNTTANRSAVFISTGFNGAPGNAFFNAGAALNSGKVTLPVFPSLMGITANTRIGVRVKTSNGLPSSGWPIFDTAPDAGGFVYVTPSALVNNPGTRSFSLLSGQSKMFSSAANAANLAQSPGDKGLLIFHSENPVATETTTLQLVP